MKPSSLSFHYKMIRQDLNELLESIKSNHDLDIYQQRSMLRDGVNLISKKCKRVIKLLESVE